MSLVNPMSIHTFVATAPCLPASTSILIRGRHGIGKSQLVRLVARLIATMEKIVDLEVIDRRLSQMSEGDLVGLPSTDGDTTRFNPPDWFKRACKKPCVLFLDEINRATHEVMQAAFQIVLDRELNGFKLHPQTRVFSAVNDTAEYTVNEIDPALLDRFWVIDLQPDTKDWLDWARGEGNINSVIIDFIAMNDKFLDPPKNAEARSVQSSRRSWERLSNALTAAQIVEEPTHKLFYPMCLGYVGVEATQAFIDFAKNYDARVSGKDIIDSYTKHRTKVKGFTVERMNACVEKLTEYVTKELKTLTDKQGSNLAAFMEDLPQELRISCWSKLTAQGLDKLELATAVHKHCAPIVLDVFGVPMGQAGIGCVPKLPGVFKAPASKK